MVCLFRVRKDGLLEPCHLFVQVYSIAFGHLTILASVLVYCYRVRFPLSLDQINSQRLMQVILGSLLIALLTVRHYLFKDFFFVMSPLDPFTGSLLSLVLAILPKIFHIKTFYLFSLYAWLYFLHDRWTAHLSLLMNMRVRSCAHLHTSYLVCSSFFLPSCTCRVRFCPCICQFKMKCPWALLLQLYEGGVAADDVCAVRHQNTHTYSYLYICNLFSLNLPFQIRRYYICHK